MSNFTPLSALAGGILIGLSVGILWLTTGRIGGVSGIFGGIVPVRPHETPWRVAFLIGLPLGATIFYFLLPSMFSIGVKLPTLAPISVLVGAGLLVGAGTRLGGGCTSGHGVCGIARLSPRSFLAVLSFMASGAMAVYIIRHLL